MGKLCTVVTAAELAKCLRGRGYSFNTNRVTELAKAHYIPFVLVDGKHLRFFKEETFEYITSHLVERVEPVPFPKVLPLVLPEDDFIPKPLHVMRKHLLQLPSFFLQGVYFLCFEDDIVYVGQSTKVASRLACHQENKVFDRVFVLPVLKDSLLEVEATFIELLRPKYNHNKEGKLIRPRRNMAGNILLHEGGETREVSMERVAERYIDREGLNG